LKKNEGQMEKITSYKEKEQLWRPRERSEEERERERERE